jgi:hypothetical protein
MYIKNILRHKDINPWKKHEHIMDTQGASDKRKKKKIRIFFVFLKFFKNKMHTKNKNK